MNSVKSRKFTVNLYLEGANVFFIGHNKHVASAMGFTLVPTGLFIVRIAVHRFVINMVRSPIWATASNDLGNHFGNDLGQQ